MHRLSKSAATAIARPLLIAGLLLIVLANTALAGPPTSPQRHALTPGVPAGATTPQAIASQLEKNTGLTPSQVTDQNVCAPAPKGFASCAAQTLIKRSDGRFVRPHVNAQRTFTQVFPSVPAGIAPQAATRRKRPVRRRPR